MIPTEIKQHIKMLLRISSYFKMNCFHYSKSPTSCEFLEKEPRKLLKYYINNFLLIFQLFFFILRLPCSLNDRTELRYLQIFTSICGIMILALAVVATSEFLIRGDFLINFTNRLYFFAEKFASKTYLPFYTRS